MKRLMGSLAVAVLLVVILTGTVFAATLNVPSSYPTIQSAIDAASSGDIVLVAPGEYVQSIRLKEGITLKSASGPAVTTLSYINWGAIVFGAPTVLGADNATIDGFTITGMWYGFGIVNQYCSMTILNNTLRSQSAGIYNLGNSSSVIANNIIIGNWRGVQNIDGATPTITNNTLIYNNMGIQDWGSHSVVTNNVIAYNQIGIYGHPTVYSNNLWGNSYTDFQDGSGVFQELSDSTMIAADPMFVNAPVGDYHLQADSPCIDAGTNAAPGLPEMDFDGNVRIIDGNGDGIAVVDIGAYEFKPSVPQTIEETTVVIQDLLTSGEITSEGTATSLTAVLDSALTAEQQGNDQAADQILEGFIHQVEGQARSGRITQEAADLLVEAARLQIAK